MMNKKCSYCKKDFIIYPSTEWRKFCSRKCFANSKVGKSFYSQKGRIPHNKGKKYEFKRRKEVTTKQCLFCGKEVLLCPSASRIKFCSSRCYWNSMRGRKLPLETTKKLRALLESNRNDTSIRKKIIQGLLRRWSNPEYREKMARVHDKMWSDSFFREKSKKAHQTNEFREKRSQITSNLYISGNYKYKGYFFSQKNNAMIGYRSKDEMQTMKIFEQLGKLKRYEYEKDRVVYIDEKGQKRFTIPDFHLYWEDGSEEVIEYKPKWKMSFEREKLKLQADEEFCKNKGWKFSIWSERDITII